jgi:hypothetical protein
MKKLMTLIMLMMVGLIFTSCRADLMQAAMKGLDEGLNASNQYYGEYSGYSAYRTKCQYRSWTVTVGSKMMYCTQDIFCNIDCF